MTKTTLSQDTTSILAKRDLEPQPCLSIVYHPNIQLIGFKAPLPQLLLGEAVEVSRTNPLFFHPAMKTAYQDGNPLDDIYLSRQGIKIELAPDNTVLIEGQDKHKLRVEGRIQNTHEFDFTALDDGIVIEIAQRIVLLLHREKPLPPTSELHGFLGFSFHTQCARRSIEQVADLNLPVLIRGESGTGKELVAHAIHLASSRANGPYVAVNIAAIPESLAASSVFGAVKGAFTGASQNQKGLFQQADNGTLFMDEIGDVPDAIQMALLRVLENSEIQPVGSALTQKINVRIISATDAPLESKISTGSFRNPLFQRLAGYEIHLQPLRHRRADIGPILSSMLCKIFAMSDEEGKYARAHTLVPTWVEIFSRFCRHHWPGNVRQLQNFATQLCVYNSKSNDLYLPENLNDILPGYSQSKTLGRAQVKTPVKKPKDISGDEVENALARHKWDIKAAADYLNISRGSLYILIDRHPTLKRARDLSEADFIASYQKHHGDLEALAEALKISIHVAKRRLGELGIGIEPVSKSQ